MTEDQILAYSGSYIASTIGSWLKPKINKILSAQGGNLKERLKLDYHDLYQNLFADYLSRRFTKFFVIDTLVFPNKQTLFDNIYYPLSLCNSSTYDDKGYKIDKYPKKILDENYRILIKDTAGMGKSTVLKKIFLECIRENQGLPVLIELRKLSKSNDLISELTNQLSDINKKCDEAFVKQLISRGDFIFLLDGFDEIPLKEKDDVLIGLTQFIEKAGNNRFICKHPLNPIFISGLKSHILVS